ncbi:MAG: sigma-70 family RNA polymerase sigma factor [Ruminococcaceae bacterium]|nr:sigma-70 family RNA polymerase sigma factor [Oscillospiraceae bacterium]
MYSIGKDTGYPKYFVEFDDGEGIHQCVEITEEQFQDFDKNELKDLSHLNEIDRHYGYGIPDEEAYDTTVETVLYLLVKEQLYRSFDFLTLTQKHRIHLYYYENLTYEQIAEKEGCTKMPVKRSLEDAKEKIKKYMCERGYFSTNSEV